MQSLVTMLKRCAFGLAAALCLAAVGAAGAAPLVPTQPVPPAPQVQPAQPAAGIVGTWGHEDVIGGQPVLFGVRFGTDGRYMAVILDAQGRVLEQTQGTYTLVGSVLTLDGGGPDKTFQVRMTGPGTLIDGSGDVWTRVA